MRAHYAKRLVGAKHAFGLIADQELVGVAIYSQPASYTLCNGVCGPEYRSFVTELARLSVCVSDKNGASILIGGSLRLLPDSVIVSYADPNVGHIGYVYQATNWLYTGQGNSEPVWVHPTTGQIVSKTRRHIDVKAKALGLEWTDLHKRPQQGKHRYVTFAGCKRFKRKAKDSLRYPITPYPKGSTTRHQVERVTARVLF